MNFNNHQESSIQPHYSNNQMEQEINVQRHPNSIQAEDIEGLYMARDKLRQFAQQIGSEKYTPLRDDVFDHCDKIKATKNQSLNYDKLEKMVKNRIQKMIKNKRLKKNWSEQDILILIWVISKYADLYKIRHLQRDLTQKNWGQIAELIPGVDGENCMFKWLSLKKNKLSDHGWSEKQASILNKLVQQKMSNNQKNTQPDWSLISQQLYYLNNSTHKVYRCPKQCRQHWNCYLNPNLKRGPWSPQQDLILLSEIVAKNGAKKWADMVKLFQGRTQNALKNRFNLIIEKQKHTQYKNRHLSEIELVNSYLQKNYVSQFVLENKKIKQPKSNYRNTNKKDEPYKQIKLQSRESLDSVPKRILRNRPESKKLIQTPQKQYDSFLCQKLEPFITTPIKIQTKMENPPWEFNPIQLTPVITISQFQNKYPSQFEPLPTQGISLNIQQPLKMQEDQIYYNLTPKNKDIVVLPDINKIKIVPVKQQDMSRIKQLLFGISKGQVKECSFVPCQISENKLTKFNC